MMSDELTLLRLRSEVATTKFLCNHTKVPVPRLIGYGEGDDDFPLFTILESLDGIRMNLLYSTKVYLAIFDGILKDLAAIHLELFSHPFDRIGMIDLPIQNSTDNVSDVFVPTLGPCSLDTWELARNGVPSVPVGPFTSSRAYYNYKF